MTYRKAPFYLVTNCLYSFGSVYKIAGLLNRCSPKEFPKWNKTFNEISVPSSTCVCCVITGKLCAEGVVDARGIFKKTVHHNRDISSGTIFFSFSLTQVFLKKIPVLNRKVLGQFSQLYYVNDGKNPSQASSFRTKRKNVAARGWVTNFYGRAILFRCWSWAATHMAI